MLANITINPTKDLYYIGAVIIGKFMHNKVEAYDFFELYKLVKGSENIGIGLFILAIDWLFLLGLVKHDTNKISLCS